MPVPALSGRNVSNLDRDDLRGRTLALATPTLLALALMFVWRFLPGEHFRWQEVSVGVVTVVAALAAWILSRRSTLGAGVLLTAGYFAAAFLGAFLVPGAAAVLFCLPIAISMVLALPWVAVLMAGTAAFSEVALHVLWQPQPHLELAVFIYASMAAVLLIAAGSQAQVLHWSWERHSAALQLSEALRDRQGQLNRTIKALDLAYSLLQRTNHELAEARQEAEEARRLKEQFAANVSHELRTPLNLIMGFSEMMYVSPEVYGQVNWTASLRRDVAQIYTASRHLLQLVDDVLDLSRLNGERMPMRKSLCSLNDVISEAVATVRDLLPASAPGSRRLRVRLELDPMVPRLLLDGGRMRQAILNLLNNAVRFTDAGEIVVRSQRAESEVLVSVSDTGAGVPAAELEAIFDEFYQTSAAVARPSSGMGLGLAIAKRFVQLHGGRIWAESPARGVVSGFGPGSTFTIALPLDDARPRATRLRTSGTVPLPSNPYAESILLMGAPRQLATDVARLLSRHLGSEASNYHVFCPTDEDEALRLVQEQHPRAIVRNLSLSEFRRLTAQLLPPKLPRSLPVLYSAIPCASWRAEMLGAAGSLQKPVRREDLLALLRNVLPADKTVGTREEYGVLVVDDDPGFVEVISRMLQAGGPGYHVRSAYSGEEGLAEMRRQPPDVLLLDLRMPEPDGPAVMARMRADPRLANIPVIVVTALDVEEDLGGFQSGLVALAQCSDWTLGDSLKAIAGLVALAHPHYEEAAETETGANG